MKSYKSVEQEIDWLNGPISICKKDLCECEKCTETMVGDIEFITCRHSFEDSWSSSRNSVE